MIQAIISLLTQKERAQVKKTTEDVNETILNDSQNEHNKVFSAADLWNIQRKRKVMIQRRYSL